MRCPVQLALLLCVQIPAYSLSGEVTPAQADQIYVKMSYRSPDVKLLFVTPEKVSLYDEIPIFRGSHLLVLFEFNLIVK